MSLVNHVISCEMFCTKKLRLFWQCTGNLRSFHLKRQGHFVFAPVQKQVFESYHVALFNRFHTSYGEPLQSETRVQHILRFSFVRRVLISFCLASLGFPQLSAQMGPGQSTPSP